MGRSQESFNKKEVRNKKEKRRREKEKKRLAKRDSEKNGLDSMIAYVDENGSITDIPPDPSKKTKIKAEDISISVPRGENVKSSPDRKGTVSFFNDSKGYGFIRDTETKESVFFHINNAEGDISEGNLVSFEVERGQKGPAAFKVKQIKQEANSPKDSGA